MATIGDVAPVTLTELTRDEAANMNIGIFGQQPGIQIYTQITYCFAVPHVDLRHKIVETLKAGLRQLTAAFPWLAGQVVNVDAGPGDSGQYVFRPLERSPDIVVKDLGATAPGLTMDALRAEDFPFRLLDESVVAPRRTLPGSPGESHLSDKPVLLVQAGFVSEGLLLTFVAHHATMDMAGQGEVIRWFSKACRGEPFTDEELTVGNCLRSNLVPLLNPGDDPRQYISEQLSDPSQPGTEARDAGATPRRPTKESWEEPEAPVQASWTYFDFSTDSLATLKQEAAATLPAGVPFVSTNDAFTAFIWQSILRARRPRLPADAPSTFARAIDVRRYMGVPVGYPGLMQNMTIHKTTVQWVCDAPLGAAAAQLRSEIDPGRLRQRTRALATYLARTPDKAASAGFSFVGPVHTAAGGLMLSSWTAVPGHVLDFGLGLGPPECVRRPAFTPVESLLYLMPQAADGSVAAGLCLRDEDLARLRADPGFAKYGRYVG